MDTVRVLLADDNHGMLKILEEYFRSKGDVEVVGSVSDGAQVMAAICQHSPDVLLLDIILPRRDGFDISVASEIMAILCLAEDINDLKKRLSAIIIGKDALYVIT